MDILKAVGTFLIALAVAVGVEKVLVLFFGMDVLHATGLATGVLIMVGLYLCGVGRKTSPPPS